MDADSELVPRTSLLEEFKISDSFERRRRTGDDDWPPHLFIGRKVYYRRAAIDDWLRRQEVRLLGVGAQAADELTMAVIRRRAKELADAGHPLGAHQVHLLQSLFADSAEVAGQ